MSYINRPVDAVYRTEHSNVVCRRSEDLLNV